LETFACFAQTRVYNYKTKQRTSSVLLQMLSKQDQKKPKR